MSYNSACLRGGTALGPTAVPMTSKKSRAKPSYNFAALFGGDYITPADREYEEAAANDGAYVPSNYSMTTGTKLAKIKNQRGAPYNTAALMGGAYLVKGSPEAKARMAYLRSLRGKSGGKRKSKKTTVSALRKAARSVLGRGWVWH